MSLRNVRRRRMQGAACVWLLVLAPAMPTSAAEQDDLTSLSLEELARTKVTSVSRTEEPRFLTPAAIHVVTADDIRRAGATTFADALRLSPGVHVARINSSQWAIGIRGFTSRLARAQLALMDGRSIYNPLFAGTYWEVQDTVLEDVDRVEVVRGPGGTLWGANAVNGIVNIVTRSAADTQGGFVTVGGGNEERGFARARHGGRISGHGHYRVYGKYAERDGGFHASGLDFDDWHQGRGGFRTDWTLRGDDHLTVQGDLYRGKAGQRTNLTFYERPFSRTDIRDADFSGGNLTTRWSHGEPGSQLTVFAYYDRARREEASFQEVRDTADADFLYQRSLGDRHRLVAGLGYRLSSGKGRGIETVGFLPPNRTDHIASAFVQHEADLASDRLKLSLGLKLERNQYTGFEVQPSVRAVWSPGPRHAVWGAVTRAVRTPSRVERDLTLTVATSPTTPIFARVIGNDSFESEMVVAYEGGYRVRPVDRVSVELAGFHNHYDTLSGAVAEAPFVEEGRRILPFRLANTLRGRSSGVEVAAIVQPSSRWVLRTEYSYLSLGLEARPGSPPSSQSAERASPRHTALVRSSWSLPGNVSLDTGFRWVDDLPSQAIPSYSSLDARVAWQAVKRLELAVVGRDLLQSHHAEFGTAALRVEVERSVFAQATWRW